MALETDISLENLLSYAAAAQEVSVILESLNKGEYDFLLVPSRGAAPIVDMCRLYFTSRRERWRGGLDGMVPEWLANPLANSLYLPFTADAGNLAIGVAARDMRRFWCRVVAGMLRAPDTDPFYGFFRFLQTRLGSGLAQTSTMYEIDGRPKGDRFVFIDTAISGQAICEIMDGFSEAGLTNILYIVVADENGEKLKPQYRQQIEEGVRAGSVFLVKMRRLFTEDRGPAVSGIWSVVFPEVMEAALKAVPEFREFGCSGAGLYFWTTEDPLSSGDRIVQQAIAWRRSAFMHAMLLPQPDHARLEEDLEAYRALIKAHRLFSRDATLEIAAPRLRGAVNLPEAQLGISSSHVLRVSIPAAEAMSAITTFRQSFGSSP